MRPHNYGQKIAELSTCPRCGEVAVGWNTIRTGAHGGMLGCFHCGSVLVQVLGRTRDVIADADAAELVALCKVLCVIDDQDDVIVRQWAPMLRALIAWRRDGDAWIARMRGAVLGGDGRTWEELLEGLQEGTAADWLKLTAAALARTLPEGFDFHLIIRRGADGYQGGTIPELGPLPTVKA